MNFLEYFGVDTSKYEWLDLKTDFELAPTYEIISTYDNPIYTNTLEKEITFRLHLDNLNKSNKYLDKLYNLFSNSPNQYYLKTIDKVSFNGYNIKCTPSDRSYFHKFTSTYESFRKLKYLPNRRKIIRVLINKDNINLYFTDSLLPSFGCMKHVLYIDTIIPQSDILKIEQKFKEEQESQGFVSFKTVSEAIENSNKESTNMNFLEYFGVDSSKYSSLYLTTDFNLLAKDLIMHNGDSKYYYSLEVYLNSIISTFVRILDKFLTNNSNQYLKEITLLYNNKISESYGYRISHSNTLSCGSTYISNGFPYMYLRYGCKIRNDIDDPRKIKRVKITESYIDLYFDDTKFKYDDDMLEVHFDQKPSLCIDSIDNNGLKQISYEEYVEKSLNGEATGSYLITGVPETIIKENEDSMNMLQIETKVLDINISSKNNRIYPSIILDSLPCSGCITVSTFDIEEIKFRDKGGTTIVFWKDGTKTILKKQKGEKNDIEKVVAMAYMKKALSMMPTAKQRDMNSIITHAQVKYLQDVAEAKKIEEEKAKKAAKKKQKQEEAKLKEESKKKPTRRSKK